MKCNSYRMSGHKAVCTDLICSRDEIQADGRVVSTPQQDSIEIFSDTQGKFRPNNISPIGSKTLFEINNGFRTVEPESYNDGLLPRAEIVLPPEQYNSTWNEKMSDFKFRMFDVYNGMFTVSHWHTGENFEVSHTFDSGRIPVGTFHNITKLACNKNKLVLCNMLLDTVWGVQANMATQSNRYPIQPAPITFMRFAPFFTATGKAQRRAQFKCTYSTTMEFYFSPDVGIDCLGLGDTAEQLAFPEDDPYEQVRAATNRFNWACHAEDFVMPLTGYILSEVETHYTNEEKDKPDREQALNETVQSRVHTALNEVGYTVTKDKKDDGTQPITIVSSDAKEPIDDQLQPQYSSDYLSAQGFSQADIKKMSDRFLDTMKRTTRLGTKKMQIMD